MEVGSVVEAAVLDVAKVGQLVDLSLKQVFVNKVNNESSNSHSEKKVKLLLSLYIPSVCLDKQIYKLFLLYFCKKR